MTSGSSRGAGRRFATLVGLAALLVGVAVLAALAGGFFVSHCGGGGEAQNGQLAMATAPSAAPARRAPAPVRIAIPAIGVDAPLIRLGLNADRSLEVPRDFGDAGWWTGGARPGEAGPAIIAGHVDSYTGPAVFYRLRDLHPGDAIIVARRDGSRARFTVIGSEQYPKARFPTARVYRRTADPALRLITCSGTFDRESGHYLDNTVVYARAA